MACLLQVIVGRQAFLVLGTDLPKASHAFDKTYLGTESQVDKL